MLVMFRSGFVCLGIKKNSTETCLDSLIKTHMFYLFRKSIDLQIIPMISLSLEVRNLISSALAVAMAIVGSQTDYLWN